MASPGKSCIDPPWLAPAGIRASHARLVRALIGLLPALCFLGALLLLDSYKLVRLRMVVATIVVGGALAGVCYVLNLAVLHAGGIDFENYLRFGAPLVEESIKSSRSRSSIRTPAHRLSVDASVLGYVVGAGFATVENLYYLSTLTDPHMAVWIVRGFGTAILHGGVQAIFAALVLANADQRDRLDLRSVLPCRRAGRGDPCGVQPVRAAADPGNAAGHDQHPAADAGCSCVASAGASAGSARASMPTPN